MRNLHDKIASDVENWRNQGYPCEEYPLIGSLLRHQWDEQRGDQTLHYLRAAQMQALETYWFLRLVKGTPRFMELYKNYYGEDESLLKALGLPYSRDTLRHNTTPLNIIEKYAEEGGSQDYKISGTFFESYRLAYPSYIFALAMGTGKTVLIGTIIATEFAMSLKYPNENFMQNALVFAPGTTIIESLRELSDIDYEKILPPYHCEQFLANLTTDYASDGNKKFNAMKNSLYNLIVSNTEKIIVRKVKKPLFQQQEIYKKNLRFDSLTQLPKLGVFSDEAHHTYGNWKEKDLKRVRMTIDSLHENRKLVCVVNTTGTPYDKKEFLKDVVIWYGIEEGIRQKVLKSLSNSIKTYSITKESYASVVKEIVKDFFETYGDVVLPEGQKAKIAFYFNSQEDLDNVRGVVEEALVTVGEVPGCLLVNTQKSLSQEIKEFNRLNNPSSNKRVVLLISKGREGWNCPSLFACALITKQSESHNYVLQASTRCLRRVAGNNLPARIYLDDGNAEIFEKQLAQTFGEGMSKSFLQSIKAEQKEVTVEILKTETPPLIIDRKVELWQREEHSRKPLWFERPDREAVLSHVEERISDVRWKGDSPRLVEKERREFSIEEMVGLQQAAFAIALPLHLDLMETLGALERVYGKRSVPMHDLPLLKRQAEETLGEWERKENVVRRVMALIHTKDRLGGALFDEKDGRLFHVLKFSKTHFDSMEEQGLFVAGRKELSAGVRTSCFGDEKNLSFHYSPYALANKDELGIFRDMLDYLNVRLHEVEGIYYTGGLTNARKTDIWFEYKGKDGRFYRYFPDFVLLKKSGEWLIVEVKSQRDMEHPDTERKAKAVERVVALQPEKIQYHSISCPPRRFDGVKEWLKKGVLK